MILDWIETPISGRKSPRKIFPSEDFHTGATDLGIHSRHVQQGLGNRGNIRECCPRSSSNLDISISKQSKKHGKSRIQPCWNRDYGFLVNEGNSVSQHLEKFGGTEMSTKFVDNGMLNIPFGQEGTTNPAFIPSG